MKSLPFLFGFLYAIFAGKYFIPLVTKRMYDLVDPEDTRQSLQKWQPPIVGVIERVLYIAALLAGHGGLIGLWVGLKVGIPYIRWSEQDRENPNRPRFIYELALWKCPVYSLCCRRVPDHSMVSHKSLARCFDCSQSDWL